MYYYYYFFTVATFFFWLSLGNLARKEAIFYFYFFKIRSPLLIGFFDAIIYLTIAWCESTPIFHDHSLSSLLSNWRGLM